MLSRRMALALSGTGLLTASSVLAAEIFDDHHFASDRQRIEQAYRAFNAAFGNAASVAALYAERAVLLPPTHDIVRGRTAIRRFWRAAFDAGLHGHTLDLVTFRSDVRTIVTAARWSARGRDARGRPATFGGIATIVFARHGDGGLAIWLHTWN